MRNLIWILIFLAAANLALADITLEKIVEDEHSTGDTINVKYMLSNTFSSDVTVTLTDTNIIAGNGYRIECLQFTAPANTKEGILDLRQNGLDIDFKALDPGKYTLGNATVMFRNPDLDIVETVVSDPVEVTIKGESIDTNHSIETMNLCDQQQQQKQEKQQEQQKEQPSKEEAQQEQRKQEEMQKKQQEEMQKQYEDQSDLQKKLEHSQQNTNQNTKATRQAFEKQRQRQQQMDRELEQHIMNQSQIRQQMKEMEKEGYKLANKSIDAHTNRSGEFSYEYEHPNGTRQKIQGKYEDDKLRDMFNTKKLQESPEYKDLKKDLEKMGMKQQGLPRKKGDNIVADFKGNDSTAQIRGEMDDEVKGLHSEINNSQLIRKILDNPSENNRVLKEEIQRRYNSSVPELSITQEPDKLPQLNDGPNTSMLAEPVPFNSTTGELTERPIFNKSGLIWIPLAAIAVIISAILLLKKRDAEEVTEEKRSFDHLEESRKILTEAVTLFDEGKMKEAYAKAGESIRLYYSHELGLRKEITNTGLIKELKQRKMKAADTQRCLNLCSLVEFARYKPNRKDFDKIIGYAKRILGQDG